MLDGAECRKILEYVEQDRDIDLLVQWRIPYGKMLGLLRALLAEELLEYDGERLRLTEAGRALLKRSPQPDAIVVPSRDPLEAARAEMKNPEAVHLPQDAVDREAWSPR